MNRRLLVVLCIAVLSAVASTGCAGTKILTNPAITFPLPVSEEKPAFLFPVNLSHLGSGGDPLAMGLVVSGGVINKFGKTVISGQQLFDLVGNLSFELAEAIQGQAHAGRWVMDGSAAKISDDLAKIMELIIKKLVDLKLLDKPIIFKYIIAVHSHGSSTMGGSMLAVESWGGIYDTETKAITSFIETKDNLANKPEAVMAALPSTYNGIISKLINGSAEAPKEEEKK